MVNSSRLALSLKNSYCEKIKSTADPEIILRSIPWEVATSHWLSLTLVEVLVGVSLGRQDVLP